MPDLLNIMGLDLSYTETGVATPTNESFTIKTKPLKGESASDIMRCRDIARQIRDAARATGTTYAVIEGGVNRSNAAFNSGLLHGIVKLMLLESGIPWSEVAPATLKKFGAGRGDAEKSAMIAHARERFGYQGFNDNEADAYLLRMMGEAAAGRLDATLLTKPRREAVLKVDWPFDVLLEP
jgi:Holliday junction resolvasome RuvABC endonuclease subunit